MFRKEKTGNFHQLATFKQAIIYAQKKEGCLARQPIFLVNLKSNTMKKSQYKSIAFFNTLQVIRQKHVEKICFITYFNGFYCGKLFCIIRTLLNCQT